MQCNAFVVVGVLAGRVHHRRCGPTPHQGGVKFCEYEIMPTIRPSGGCGRIRICSQVGMFAA
jgi:hypothetical protein